VPLNPTRGHSALAVHTLRPLDFGQQLNIDHSQAWGILKSLVNVFLNQEDGQFVLLKDPAGPKVKLYQVGPSGLQGPVKETAQ
jgi:translation initiation factor 3 subunit D